MNSPTNVGNSACRTCVASIGLERASGNSSSLSSTLDSLIARLQTVELKVKALEKKV